MQSFADELKAETETAATIDGTDDVQADEPSAGASTDTGDTGATGDIDSAPPSTGSTSDAKVPLRALEDEREKRQYERQLREGLERRLADLEARLSPPTEPTAPDADVPYDNLFENPKAVFDSYSQALEKKFGTRSMAASVEMARAQLPDYDETIGKLESLNVPGIQDAVAKSASPAFTAYRMVKDHERAMAAKTQSPETDELKRQLAEAQQALAEIRGEIQRPPKSIGQSRGSSAGTAQPVRTVDDVLAAAWDKGPLRAR